MNKIISLTGVIFICVLLLCCKSSQEITQNNPPFKVLESTYIENVERGGEKGTMVSIKIDNPNIKLDSIYFRNMKSPLIRTNKTSEEKYLGYFKFPKKTNDIILHSDSKKEFGNQVPDISQRISFQLEKNEAMVRYVYKGKISYYKILKLSETK